MMDPATLTSNTNSSLLDLYRMMRRIRTFEERVAELFVRGASAGSMLHHRGHGIFLARGASPDRMMAEIGGKDSGYCRGKGGSMHIADMALGHLGANAIVGGGIPHVVGAGLGARQLGRDSVAVAFFGDGAMQQGLLYESMNMVALWRLPVLFVCINNQYGMGTRIDRAAARVDFDAKASAFGLQAAMVDGVDVEAVRDTAQDLINSARAGRPGFLAVSCFRFYGHGRMDKSPYRDAEEEVMGRKRDPLIAARASLIASAFADESSLNALDEEVSDEMNRALDFAVKSEIPTISSMFRDVYGPSEPEPEPLRARIDRILARQ